MDSVLNSREIQPCTEATSRAAHELAALLQRWRKLVVISGAGCSTASGIPDYRDGAGVWKRAQPVMYQDFIASPAARQRYWARSLVGYRFMAAAEANSAHRSLAQLEATGYLHTLITQNVDRLHQAAGSRRVIDLHGRIDQVICLDCNRISDRQVLQQRLQHLNPAFADRVATIAPDGDADMEAHDLSNFTVPDCDACDGRLKPNVVFFGESVPKSRVTAASDAVEGADGLLAVGTSLMVFSSFRFARQAAELGKPIIIVNRGRTRADALAARIFDARCEAILQAAVRLLDNDA